MLYYHPDQANTLDIGTSVLAPNNVVRQGIPTKQFRGQDSTDDDEQSMFEDEDKGAQQQETSTGMSLSEQLMSWLKASKEAIASLTSLRVANETLAHARVGLENDYDVEMLTTIDPDQHYAIVPQSQKSSRFHISVPSGFQAFLPPRVIALQNSLNQDIVSVTVTGPASKGGLLLSKEYDLKRGLNLTAVEVPDPDNPRRKVQVIQETLDEKDSVVLKSGKKTYSLDSLKNAARIMRSGDVMSSWFDVEYVCKRPGLTSVLVVIQLDPKLLGSIPFRLVKFCGAYTRRTASNRFFSERNMMVFFMFAMPVIGLLYWLWSAYGSKLLNGGSDSQSMFHGLRPSKVKFDALSSDSYGDDSNVVELADVVGDTTDDGDDGSMVKVIQAPNDLAFERGIPGHSGRSGASAADTAAAGVLKNSKHHFIRSIPSRSNKDDNGIAAGAIELEEMLRDASESPGSVAAQNLEQLKQNAPVLNE